MDSFVIWVVLGGMMRPIFSTSWKNRDNNLWGCGLSVDTESNYCTSINVLTQKPFLGIIVFVLPPTLYCSPLTDICVLPLGLSHLNWWCSAFYWPCSCFVCKDVFMNVFYICTFYGTVPARYATITTCEVNAHSSVLPSRQWISNPFQCGQQTFMLLLCGLASAVKCWLLQPKSSLLTQSKKTFLSGRAQLFPASYFFHHLFLPQISKWCLYWHLRFHQYWSLISCSSSPSSWCTLFSWP